MDTIAVIGAGIMGGDVALNLSCFGYSVILKDISEDVQIQTRKKIAGEFRMTRMLRPFYAGLDADQVLGRIRFTTDYDDFDKVSIVIENISEDWQLKEKLYKELATVCPAGVLYCVNTSCISITRLAALLPQPENVVGMHFMNPVPLKDLVEMVKGYHTSETTIQRARAFLKTLNKTAVVVEDYPGFVANRLSHLFMNEAVFLVQDRVASPKDIDTIFKKGYGHAMGPLETADLIGLDTVVNSLEILYASYQDPKFRCCPLLRKMVAAGLLGKKSGQGFYKYDN